MPINNPFLKATPLYKEYAILELLAKDSNITQRAIAKELDSSLSMVNQYLEEYEKKELIKRNYINGKSVEYYLTEFGRVRLNVLNIKFLEAIRKSYLIAKDNVIKYLNQILEKGYRKILMYGAGEVAELTLQVLLEEKDLPLKVLAIIDDSKEKQGKDIMGIKVISKDDVIDYDIDGILISSYAHFKTLRKNLISIDYPKDKIFDYFTK